MLQQNFTADTPNQRWVADLTYVATAEGWLYVAAVLDLFSRRVIGLAMSERMTTDIVLKALEQAVLHRQPCVGVIHHADKGSQYTSYDFQSLLTRYGMVASRSGQGIALIMQRWKASLERLKESMFTLSTMKHAIKLKLVFLNTA